ncbi:MAG: DNA gyrase subunit A [Acutalibacter sp.]|nr:DNA gyrase subunit A [Acutalibacter sp.]
MAHNRDYKPEDIAFPNQHITESELVGEMQDSYIQYAMSVIKGRALPDVRDGLKPVHRRILYTLYEDGLTADKPFKKSATCVGDVLGKYHPHGDTAAYEAMVRLAQSFSMRYMLVDGHGNFGSVDGDPPAAYRYTEARLSKISAEMLRDIDKETVDWDPNFDESLKEPRVLPSRFPNLLVNGSSGIAVGMATNIPPHNLREVINAVVCELDNPDATLEELMEHIQGPDFPTSGIIMGRAGIRAAYATGRGRITVRAKAEFEDYGKDRTRIIVNELPYQVNKRQLIKNIADQIRDKRLDGISDLRDETDRNGMRIVIELKRDANPQVVLNRLFRQTAMQSNFSVIMLALVNNQTQPKILNLKSYLDEYIAFQEEIITRRTQYDLRKAQERAHLLEGLLIAQDNIDEVIRIIRESYDNARENLMKRFGLDEIQAQAICDMRLISLQGLNREKLEAEYKELEEKIAYYQELLGSEEKIRGVLKEELLALAKKYGDDRKTEIQDVPGEIDIEDLIPEEECVLTLTNYGYVKRQKIDTYHTQRRGGRGVTGMSRRDEDVATELFVTGSHDYVMFFSDLGRVYRLKCYEIPEGSRQSRGMNIRNLLPLQQDEKITSMIRVTEFDSGKFLVMVTRNGIIKRTRLSAYDTARKGGLIAINLDEGDALSWVRITDGTADLLVATKKGMSIRFRETGVRELSRTARGVKVMNLQKDDCIVGMSVLREGGYVLTVTETGYGRLSYPENYRLQKRGGKGLKNYHTERFGDVAGIKVVDPEDDVIMISEDGIIIRIQASSIRVCSRPSKGVRVMKLQEGSRVVTLARAPHEEDEVDDVEIEDDGSAEEGANTPEDERKELLAESEVVEDEDTEELNPDEE